MVSCYTVFNIYVQHLLFTPYRPKELIEYQYASAMNVLYSVYALGYNDFNNLVMQTL